MDGTSFITSSFALQNTPALQTKELVIAGLIVSGSTRVELEEVFYEEKCRHIFFACTY